jgi:hypothetical protein
MPGLVPGIHDFSVKHVDGLDKPGHDEFWMGAVRGQLPLGFALGALLVVLEAEILEQRDIHSLPRHDH